MTSTETALTGERADFVQTLGRHRGFLRHTVRGLTDEQATQRSTVSELNLAGLIKHVAASQSPWARFSHGGAAAMLRSWGSDAQSRRWYPQVGETLGGLLADYDEAARHMLH